jgi:ATP-dependent protease ClpP protease subunit
MGLKINNAKGERTRIEVYGDIGDPYNGVTAKQFASALAEIPAKEPINVHIFSDGGSFFDGVSIHGQIRNRAGETHTIVDGLAASAASLIAMAGKTITMAKHSWMMIHEARGAMSGRAEDFRAAADQLERTNGEIMKIYSERWKGTEQELRDSLINELWLTDEETVASGLADSISGDLAIAAHIDESKYQYKNVPKRLKSQEYLLELEKRASFV